MSFYQQFDVFRAEPDIDSLLTTLRGVDPTAGIQHSLGTTKYIIKKETAWTQQQIINTNNAITNAPNSSGQLSAQTEIDHYSISVRALVLTLIDEINILRVNASLAPRTPAQAIQAIRNKAATL